MPRFLLLKGGSNCSGLINLFHLIIKFGLSSDTFVSLVPSNIIFYLKDSVIGQYKIIKYGDIRIKEYNGLSASMFYPRLHEFSCGGWFLPANVL